MRIQVHMGVYNRSDRRDIFVFFFQAEDGIRDATVTGVQTCALPIFVASMYSAALRRLSETDGFPTLGVEVTGDGAAAFDRLLRAPPVDVLVTDVFMPVLSGISLVEKIRAEAALADLPIVVITSGGDRERERLASLGVALFLRKPVSYQDVTGAIRTLLATRLAAGGPGSPASQGGSPGGADGRKGLTDPDGV